MSLLFVICIKVPICQELEERARAIGLLEAGRSVCQTPTILGCSHTAINDLKRKWQVEHTVTNLPKVPRSRVSNNGQDALLRASVVKSPFKTIQTAMEDANFPASYTTVKKKNSTVWTKK